MKALTIPELRAADPERRDALVSECERQENGWSVTCSDGWSLWITDARNPKGIVPKVGQPISIYGRFGQPVHGVDLGTESVYWMTEKEREADYAVMLAKIDRDRREQYERDREKQNATVEALSPLLKKRMERFRLDRPEEDALEEGYEIFCCQQAEVIVEICKREMPNLEPSAAIEWFRALPYDLQKKMGVDDGHSGNTFGGACMLALRVLAGCEV